MRGTAPRVPSAAWKVIVEATFVSIAPNQKLNLTTSGTGTGSFECEDITEATAAAPCVSGDEFPENDEVKVIPVEDPGSEFVEFNNENGGECTGATCTVTMSAERNVNAVFNEIPKLKLNLSTSGTGTGSFECEDITEATAAAPCVSGDEFPENDEVKVIPVEDPGSEFVEFKTKTAANAPARPAR